MSYDFGNVVCTENNIDNSVMVEEIEYVINILANFEDEFLYAIPEIHNSIYLLENVKEMLI